MQASNAMTAPPARRPRSAPKPRRQSINGRKAEADYRYTEALAFVKRRRYVALRDVCGLGIPIETARQMLLRMQRDGVLQAPDMFGTWTRATAQAEGGSHE